jgi:hypothetical protein
MLRWLVIALVAANAAFYAWTLGWLDDVVGVRAVGDREPARLGRQVRPESVIILPASGAGVGANGSGTTGGPSATNPPGGSTNGAGGDTTPRPTGTNIVAAGDTAVGSGSCLEAGPFTQTQFAAVLTVMQGAQPTILAGSWIDVRNEKPGSWMVYMGRYPNREALERKQEELRRVRGATFEEVRDNPELSPGLSLGRFDQRVKAEQALEALSLRGLRTARVVQLAAPSTLHLLRADKPGADLAEQLAALRFEGTGRKFSPCGAN